MLSRTTALAPIELKSAIVRSPLVVSPSTTVLDAIAQMSGVRDICDATKATDGQMGELHLEARSSCVLVVENRQVLGVLTERDIVRLSAQKRSLENLEVQAVMAHPVVCLHEAAFTDFLFAISLLQQYHIRHLPILDEQDHLVGLVTHESLRQISRPIDLLRLRLVAEVMTRQVICASPESSMLTIVQQMAEHRVSSVMIVQPGGDPAAPLQIPVGILTERDIVQFQALGLNLETYSAQAVMSSPIFTVSPNDPLWTVQQIMEQRLIRRLAVTGAQGELLGIVTQTSVLQALNPFELYKLAEVLGERVTQLEAEKLALLENRTIELEQQVEARTSALKTKAEREQLVAYIANRIRTSLDFQEILDACVAEVRSFLNCDRVLVYQFQPDWSGLIIAESVAPGWRSALGNQFQDSCFQQQTTPLYQTEQPIAVNNIYQTNYADCHIQLLEQYQVKANLIVPIRVSGELWGLLIGHQCADYRQWQPEDATLLRDIAVQLAIALQQATLYQELQDQLIERQQAEARLRESEERYVSLTAAAPVGIFCTDTEGNSIYINQRCCEMLGLSADVTTGNGWQQALHPEDRDRVIAETRRTRQENRPFQMEYRILHADGNVIWVLGQAVAEQDVEGQVIGYVGTITDISDRKRSEEALQKNLMHQQALMKAIPDLIMRIDREGIFLEFIATPNFQVVGNLPDVVGRQVSEALPPDLAQQRMKYIQLALQTNSIQIYEQDLSIDGKVQIEEVRIVPYGEDEVLALVRDITARKQAERALAASEAQSRAVLSAIPDMMFRVGADGKYRGYVTQKRDFDVVPHDIDLTGQSMSDVLSEQQAERQFYYLQQALETGDLQIYEQTLQVGSFRKDEEVRIVKSGDDEVLFMLRDISDRKQAEWQLNQLNQELEGIIEERTAQLREQEARLHDFFDNANDLIQSVLLANGQFEYVNRIWRETLGYSATEVSSLTIFDVLHPNCQEDYRTAMMRIGDGLIDTIERVELIFLTKAQQEIIVEGSINCRRENDRPVATRAIFRDISDRKRAEQMIQQQVERETLLREITQRIRQSLDIQTIFDTACQEIRAVLHADRVGIFKFYPNSDFNDGEFVAESVVKGFPSIVAMHVHDHCFGENYSSLYAKGRFQVVDDIDASGMTPCHTDILERFQVRANLVMPLLRGDALWGLLCIHQCAHIRHWQQSEIDFTQQIANQLAIAVQQASLFEQLQQELVERQQAEAKLTESNHQLGIFNEELARATRLKDEFLANMSHELRTPLNAILGMTEGLQDGVFGSIYDSQRKALQTIERSGSHLLELINDILDVAKIESGQLELEANPTSTSVLCQSSLTFIRQQALKKSIRLELKLPPQLPDLWVDERRIRQVLINLLNNAVKFTPNGGHITLEIRQLPPNHAPLAAAEQHFLQIAVSDTGIGIAPEHLHKLFQPFVQIDSALNRQYAGTGLGLALVKRIVELHGGNVNVTSELGIGSCFTIELPCAPDISRFMQERVGEQLVIPTLDQVAAGTACQAPLILMAEDNEANISTVSSYLEAKGYRILLANNGRTAIELAKAHQPDLILMDIQMPGMNGLEAIQQIRCDPDLMDVSIIALTALAMAGDRERCLAAGANDYLSKPVKLKQLAATIQQFLVMK